MIILKNTSNTKYDTNQLGGKCYDDEYILLSCTEFNSLVDDLLLKNMDSTSILQKNNLEYDIKKSDNTCFFY